MSNYEPRIETNNTELEGILEAINALPDAGSGGGGSGGGGTLETCTVALSTPANCNLVYYTLDSNGEAVMKSLYVPFDIGAMYPQLTVIKGSHLLCGVSTKTTGKTPTITGEAVLVRANEGGTVGAIFKINGDCSITLS